MISPPSAGEPEISPADGTSSDGSGAICDTEADLSDDALRLMELRHRTKNILAIVQALVNQTLRGEVTIDEARQALTDRLVAMGNAVDLLIGKAWEPTELKSVLACALTHAVKFGERVKVSGPEVHLGSGAAMTLSLALHELESNAIKYGALSDDVGSVHIEWSISPADAKNWLQLEWREENGPPVLRPNRSGFGTKLISSVTGRRLGGAAECQFQPEGFRWILLASAEGLAS